MLRSMRPALIPCLVVVAFSSGVSSGLGQLIDVDRDTIIDATNSQPTVGVRVLDRVGGPSLVTVVYGGAVATDTGTTSQVFGSSTLSLDGGTVGGPIEVHANGKLLISEGTITTDHFALPRIPLILARDDAQVSVRGGYLRAWIDHTIVARGRSQVSIEAGEIQSKDWLTLLIDESSVVNIYGGTIFGGEDDGIATVTGNGTLNIHGGSLLYNDDDGSIVFAEGSGVVNILGGKIEGDSDQTEIRLSDQAVANIYGYGLTQAGGELSGLLLDANRLRLDFEVRDNAELHLHEMTPPEQPGDLNQNMQIDSGDIDLIGAAIRHNVWADPLDMDEDGVVGPNDFDVLLKNILQVWRGDSNLDGEFNSSDLVDVFKAGEYDDALRDNSGWADGDWDGDGDFLSGDLVVAFQEGGYEQGPREQLVTVPEPAGILLIFPVTVGLLLVPRTRRKLV